MLGAREREIWLLLLGDVFVLYISLWLTLFLRYLEVPTVLLWQQHLAPFTAVIVCWIVIFYISGLYDKHTVVFKRHLTSTVLHAQFFNLLLAILFFFALPWSNLTPKRNLLIYVVLSSLLLIGWRLIFGRIPFGRKKYTAILVADGPEVAELVEEVNGNTRYQFEIITVADSTLVQETPDVIERLLAIVREREVSLVIVDSRNPRIQALLPSLFSLAFLDFRFSIIDMNRLYEDLFDRVPLSTLNNEWFMEHLPQSSHKAYDFVKRIIDIIGALILGAFLLLLLPLIWLFMRIEGKGPLFSKQERMGPFNKKITVHKLRTMKFTDSGAWIGEVAENAVTKVGKILRITSLDELPQCMNILAGEMSLIGPRNDLMALALRASDDIPYYAVRYIVKPGITGWAQTHQQYAPGQINPESIDSFKLRLAYDLYYVKHRSFLLDLSIALRTLATVTQRVGSLVTRM